MLADLFDVKDYLFLFKDNKIEKIENSFAKDNLHYRCISLVDEGIVVYTGELFLYSLAEKTSSKISAFEETFTAWNNFSDFSVINTSGKQYICINNKLSEIRPILIKEGWDLSVIDENNTVVYLAFMPHGISSDGRDWVYKVVKKDDFFSWTEKGKFNIDLEQVGTLPGQLDKEQNSPLSEKEKEGMSEVVWVYNDLFNISEQQENVINRYLFNSGYSFYFNFVRFPEKNFEREINSLISAGKAPDIISAGLGENGTLQGTYQGYVNDWYLQIDDFLESENGKALKESIPEKMWESFKINGKTYGVSGVLPIATDYVYYLNMDIADKYGIKPEDLEGKDIFELSEVLAKVKDNDIYMDLSRYTYEDIIKKYTTVMGLHGNQSTAITIDDNGKVVNLFEQNHTKQVLKKLNEYREKGY